MFIHWSFASLVGLALLGAPIFVYTQNEPELLEAVADCYNQLATEYNRGEMRYKEWLIRYRECYVQNGAAHLIPESLNTYATVTNTFDNNFATADCVVELQRWYSGEISDCLGEKARLLEPYQNWEKINPADYEKIRLLTSEVEQAQQTCYQGTLLEEYKRRNAACYQNSSFGGIWDLPILKQTLVNQLSDFQKLPAAKAQALDQCLRLVAENNDVKIMSAPAEKAISRCFELAGLQGLADVYAKANIVVDCAIARWPIQTTAEAWRVATGQSAEEKLYLEQCVMRRVAPVGLGAAAASVPLAAGWRTFFLFGQLLITQPLVLYRRRKYKAWGTVFDTATTDPVDLGAVRLVRASNNQIIKTAVTNRQGRYLFLPTPGTYRVEVDKSGYVFPSTWLARGADARDHYFGEPITIQNQHEIIDRQIPIDPEAKTVSIWKFNLWRWRYRLAVLLGFASPLVSLVGFIILRTWWLGLLVLAHSLIFGVLFRLSFRRQTRQFGLVRDQNKKPLTNVVVRLFRAHDNKLLNYYVTDWFGRYYFPRLVGDFTIIFDKKGYLKKEIVCRVKPADKDSATIKTDVVLEPAVR